MYSEYNLYSYAKHFKAKLAISFRVGQFDTRSWWSVFPFKRTNCFLPDQKQSFLAVQHKTIYLLFHHLI